MLCYYKIYDLLSPQYCIEDTLSISRFASKLRRGKRSKKHIVIKQKKHISTPDALIKQLIWNCCFHFKSTDFSHNFWLIFNWLSYHRLSNLSLHHKKSIVGGCEQQNYLWQLKVASRLLGIFEHEKCILLWHQNI